MQTNLVLCSQKNVVEISMLFRRKFENQRYPLREKLAKFRRWSLGGERYSESIAGTKR